MNILNSIAIALVFCAINCSVHAQHQIQFMASDTSWSNSEYVGHAFMVLSTRVGNGNKEDAYGFYPKNAKALIYGPGVVNSEFTKNPTRFSRVTISFERPITESQRSGIMKIVADWNNKDYALTSDNCIDFVNSVATFLGWVTPARIRGDLPATFLKKLQAANESNQEQMKVTKDVGDNSGRDEMNGVEMVKVDKTHIRFENVTNTPKLVVFEYVVTNPFLNKDETYHEMGIPLDPKQTQVYDHVGWTFVSAKLISAKP